MNEADQQIARHAMVDAPGGAEAMVLRASQLASPASGEILLRQEAIGLNYHDIYVRSGAYSTMPYPGTPGIEAAGTIEEVGPGVTEFRAGQRVAYICAGYGAYADRRIIAASNLVPLPDEIDAGIAAAALLKGVTAHMLLSRFTSLHPGDAILVHAAVGGVGQLLVQMARMMGLRVLGTVGDENKVRLALSLGCEIVAVRGQDEVLTMIENATSGAGVQAVFDGIGAATLELSLSALAPFGHCCLFGQVSGAPTPVELSRLAQRSLSISRPIVFHHVADPDAYRRSADTLFAGLSDGSINLAQPMTFALSDVAEAHRALESGMTTGSIILVP